MCYELPAGVADLRPGRALHNNHALCVGLSVGRWRKAQKHYWRMAGLCSGSERERIMCHPVVGI